MNSPQFLEEFTDFEIVAQMLQRKDPRILESPTLFFQALLIDKMAEIVARERVVHKIKEKAVSPYEANRLFDTYYRHGFRKAVVVLNKILQQVRFKFREEDV